MPSQRIPNNKRWNGIFEGEYFGNVWLAKNIDFNRNKGKAVLGDSLSSVFDDGDDADLSTPVAFIRTAADGTDRWWVNGGKLFKTTNTDPETGWTQDALSNSPDSPLYDLHEFVDDLYVPTDTDIDQLSSGTWTNGWWSSQTGASSLQSGVPHRLWTFSGAMLITDGRYINSWDGTLAVDPDLTLPSNMEAQWGRSTADFAFIGCKSLDGSEAEVYFWDRVSKTFNARYPIGDSEALAGWQVDGIPYIVTKKGAIKRFTGQGFRTVQQFPTLEAGQEITKIDPNGVVVDESTVKMNVNFGTISDMRTISGIWTYESDTNILYHSNSIKNGSGNDYSQQEISDAGAMKATSPTQGRFLVGGEAYTDYSSSTLAGIFTFDESSTSNRGYIITPKLVASSVRKFWREIHAKFRIFQDSTDRIRVLYKTQEDTNLPEYETITLVNGTSFTGSNSNVAVNDFVEILAGDNAGAIAKITDIQSGSPNTYTIDLTLNSSTNDARARYLKFKDLGTVSSQSIQEKVFRIAKRSNHIQFLFELRGTEISPELEEVLINFDEIQF